MSKMQDTKVIWLKISLDKGKIKKKIAWDFQRKEKRREITLNFQGKELEKSEIVWIFEGVKRRKNEFG